MKATVPYRANCDAIQQLRSKRRKENPKPRIAKRTYAGSTLEHLTIVNERTDHYSYYHATKGWRWRRIGSKTDLQIMGRA